MRRFRRMNSYARGFSCVLLCLSLGYLYLFSIQSQLTLDQESAAIAHHRGLLSEQLRSERLQLLNSLNENSKEENTEKDNGNKGWWKVLEGNVTIHAGIVNNPHEYQYLINNEKLCSGLNSDQPSLLIYVESDVKNFDRRLAIRDTWGELLFQRAINFRIVFLLGNSRDKSTQRLILEENYRYGDVVQENFPESFRNLALKSVMGLKWTTANCANADYVMKTDDDIFIHVPNLLRLLDEEKKRGKTEDYVVCHRNRLRNIIRKGLLDSNAIPKGYQKYLVTKDELPGQYYPAYCAGFGYLMTIETANKLYAAALQTPYFFIEDALITGFVRHKANVLLRDHGAFTLRPPVTPREGSCAFREGRITTQEMGPPEMRELWREINTRGFFCPQVVGYIPNQGNN